MVISSAHHWTWWWRCVVQYATVVPTALLTHIRRVSLREYLFDEVPWRFALRMATLDFVQRCRFCSSREICHRWRDIESCEEQHCLWVCLWDEARTWPQSRAAPVPVTTSWDGVLIHAPVRFLVAVQQIPDHWHKYASPRVTLLNAKLCIYDWRCGTTGIAGIVHDAAQNNCPSSMCSSTRFANLRLYWEYPLSRAVNMTCLDTSRKWARWAFL